MNRNLRKFLCSLLGACILALAGCASNGSPASSAPGASVPASSGPDTSSQESSISEPAISSSTDTPEPEAKEGYQKVSVLFPAYEEGRTEYNGHIFDTPPFSAQLELPETWEVRRPDPLPVDGSWLWTPMDIYENDQLVGKIAFNRYTEPEEGSLPPQEEYYKVVYSELRLPRMETWEPYTPVRTDENGESGIASVVYVDPDFIQENPGASMAAAPEQKTKGILCYNKDMAAYVALRIDGSYQIDEETLTAVAQSLQLVPQENKNS